MTTPYSFARRLVLPTLCTLALAGCSSTYRFKVDAIKNQEIPEERKSFRIVSANPEMDEEDLRFKEAARYVRTALSAKGMYEAPKGQAADMTIEVDWGMEEPRSVFSTVSNPIAPPQSGLGSTIQMPVNAQQNGQLILAPQEMPVVVTVYEKYMRVTARENPKEGDDRPAREAWSVYVSNEDQSDNLREYLPLMVSAAMDSMDKKSAADKEVVLKDGDARVAFVKTGM